MTKRYREEGDNIRVANVLMMLSKGEDTMNTSAGRVYVCKTCDRQFASFQALGGHRASHKKAKVSDDDDRNKMQKPKVHECSICGIEFAIGQALGGHMRRHRAAAAEGFGHGFVEKKSNGKRVLLDLNLPPLELEEDGEGGKLGLGLGLGICRI